MPIDPDTGANPENLGSFWTWAFSMMTWACKLRTSEFNASACAVVVLRRSSASNFRRPAQLIVRLAPRVGPSSGQSRQRKFGD